MAFSPEDLELLEREDEIRIETRAGDGTEHRTIVWVVVDRGEVFVRSVRGRRGRWYREALAAGRAAIGVARRSIPVRVVHTPDPRSVERTSHALERKYGRDPALRTILRPHTLDTTLRLEPG